MPTEGFGSVTAGSMFLAGDRMSADVANAIVDEPKLTRTIDGASTVKITIDDSRRKLIDSQLLQQRSTLLVDGLAFELVQVTKEGDQLDLTFEDLAVAALRRHTGLLTAEASIVTRAGFVRRLVSEEPWLRVDGPTGEAVKEQLSRGRPIKPGAQVTQKAEEKQDDEDSWAAISRLADEVAWRVFASGNVITFAPDDWLMAKAAAATVKQFTNGVDFIDFDYDNGKHTATATVHCRADRWEVGPGEVIEIADLGVASGRWLTSQFERGLYNSDAEVALVQPRPAIPEPDAGDGVALGETDIADIAGQSTGDPSDASPTGHPLPAIRPLAATAAAFVMVAQSQVGKPYRYGSAASLEDPSPAAYDCSLLVQWAAHQVHVELPRTAADQFGVCLKFGSLLSVADAANTRGALIFKLQGGGANDHVVISLGDGKHTIEAMGSQYGVVKGEINRNRGFSRAALIPGLDYALRQASQVQHV